MRVDEIETKEEEEHAFTVKTIKYLATRENLAGVIGKMGAENIKVLNERLNTIPNCRVSAYNQLRVEAYRVKYFRTSNKKLKLGKK